jgi:predicted site-specific integrase-resolvase
LLEYSDEEAIKILMNRMRKDRAVYAKLRSNNAFKELERSVDKSLNQDEVQSLSNIEKELDDLGDNNRYIKTVPSIGPDKWMTE